MRLIQRSSEQTVVISTSRTLAVLPQEEHNAYETGIILTLPRRQSLFSCPLSGVTFSGDNGSEREGDAARPPRVAVTLEVRRTPRFGACAIAPDGPVGPRDMQGGG